MFSSHVQWMVESAIGLTGRPALVSVEEDLRFECDTATTLYQWELADSVLNI